MCIEDGDEALYRLDSVLGPVNGVVLDVDSTGLVGTVMVRKRHDQLCCPIRMAAYLRYGNNHWS